MPEEIAIRVDHVSKDFVLPHEKTNSIKGVFTGLTRRAGRGKETQHALKDVSFEVKKGEFFGVVGRNGSGKSTLLKILAGIYQPNKGGVHINGKLVPFIELGVGFNPELTGRENVYLNGAMLGFSESEVDDMYDDIVAFAELGRFMDQKLKNYSSGMQVRLAFSMATRSKADILLVDEVLAVGDADFQRKCFQYFKSLKRNNKTVVFVSHDMSAVREYCDRAVLIQESELKVEGPAEVVAQAYLKLFNSQAQDNPEDDDSGVAASDTRWGNRWITFDSSQYKLNSKQLLIQANVTAHRDLEDVTYGFRIRSADGAELMGTNSKILQDKALALGKGGTARLSWVLPNIFSDGEYYIDLSLIMHDGASVCDWWNEAQVFDVVNEHSTSYPVTPPISAKAEYD